MKNYIINNTMDFISKYNKYDDIKLEELEYGLVSIYLLVSKLIIIIILSSLLGIFKEMILFTLLYIPIRAVSFGLHASKSWICLLASTLTFIGVPILANHIETPIIIKSVIGIIAILLMFKNAPADTHKRPIVNPKRRLFFKYLSVIFSIIYVCLAFMIKSSFIANSLLMALITQCCLTSPTIYKLFKLPYDNYKNYNLS